MVAVGYVKLGDFGKCFGDGIDGGVVVNHPEGVAEAVGGHEIILRLAGDYTRDYLVERLIVGEGEEHGFDVGVLDTHVLHAVLLLVAAGELVLLDAAFHVVVDVGSDDDAVLRAAVHGLRIYIIVFLVVLHEPSLALECVEILDGALVHLGGVLVLAGSEVDFGLDDVVERLGVAFGLGTCFLAVEHIVGTRSHFGDKLFGRTDSLERFNFCHVS